MDKKKQNAQNVHQQERNHLILAYQLILMMVFGIVIIVDGRVH
jgi:uncharacterized membrane protein